MKDFIIKQKNYIKWLFRKPNISFDRKLNAKDVVDIIKSRQLYELRGILPKVNGLTRGKTISLLGASVILGIVLSVITGNPLPFFLMLGITYGSIYTWNSGATGYGHSVDALDSTHIVVVFEDESVSSHGTAIVGTITSGNVITYGSKYVFNSASVNAPSVSALDSTHFVVAYKDDGGDSYGCAKIGTVSNDDEVAYGSEYIFNSASTTIPVTAALDSTHFVVAYYDVGTGHGTAIIGTVSSVDQIAYGSEYAFNTATTFAQSVSALDSTHFVVAYRDGGNSNYGTARIGVVSSVDNIAYGSEYVFSETTVVYTSVAGLDSTHFVIVYKNGTTTYGASVIGTVSSGNNIAYGSEYNFNEAVTVTPSVSALDSTHFIVAYKDDGGDDYGIARVGTVSGNAIAYGAEAIFNSAITTFPKTAALDGSNFVVAYENDSTGYGDAIVGNSPAAPATGGVSPLSTLSLLGVG